MVNGMRSLVHTEAARLCSKDVFGLTFLQGMSCMVARSLRSFHTVFMVAVATRWYCVDASAVELEL